MKALFLKVRVTGLLLGSLVPLTAAEETTPLWDVGEWLGKYVQNESGSKVKISFEHRWRYETRGGVNFGKDPDKFAALGRTRFGMSYTPVSWLKMSGMVQDARAPLYGPGAPNTLRDTADLHEAYIELFPNRKTGFGFFGGRAEINYGEGRLLGSPQWSNLGRTYDQARAYYRTTSGVFEFLAVSPVKILSDEFNHPVLGDHIFGMYNSFPKLFRRDRVDIYILRHEQNRPGGFTGGSAAAGTDRLTVDTFGFRMAGPLGGCWKYSLESAWQTGTVGPADHRARAWYSAVTRRFLISHKALDVTAEYKYASGSDNPSNLARSGTFDQLYAANHDRFGHQDLFGWRNLHNARSLGTFPITGSLNGNLMYNSYWLASARDSLYGSSGKSLARSAAGTAGQHVGQEIDAFVTYKYRHFVVGAGYSYLVQGAFLRNTTPGVDPTYVYVFHTYAF